MRTPSPYSVKSIIKRAYEASTLLHANFDRNPERDKEIKEAISLYVKSFIELPLKTALEKMEKKRD